MSEKFSYYDEQTGEYIETKFNHLNLPDNLETPVIDGVERTMNLGITRASGWHYADGGMLFIPAYRKVSGQSLGFKISYLNSEGKLNKKGIMFEFSNSRSFNSKIPIGDIFNIAFDISDAEQIKSLVGCNSELLTSAYIKQKAPDELLRSIKNKKLKNSVDLTHKLRTMITKQTMLDSPNRLYDLLSLSHFKGCSLADHIEVGNMFYSKFTVLDDALVFDLTHSGLDSVTLLTSDHKRVDVSIVTELYCKLDTNEIPVEKQKEFTHLEENNNQFEFDGKIYSKEGAPPHNTLNIYCAIINRLFAFDAANINFSMQDYKNQKIVTFRDKVLDFEREDLQDVENRILNTRNLLEGVSGHHFDVTRAERLIKNADSALAVITKNENPLAKTSQGQVLVRDVQYLAKEAIQVLPQDLGVIDPVDTPESKNIGKSTPLTLTTQIGKDGSLYTPLYKVVDGEVTTEVEMVHVGEIPNLFIAEEGVELKGNVLAKHKGVVKLFPSHVVTHVRVSPFSTTSACRASAVFMENTDQKRTQMTANAQKQARTILRPSRARIETGVESIAANGGTGLKHKFTVKEIFEEQEIITSGLEDHTFEVEEIADTGMKKEYRLTSMQNPNLSAVFSLTTEKSFYGSSYYYELVAPSGLNSYYQLNDIVYKQHNVIVGGTVEGTDRLDYHTGGDPEYFNLSIANGVDLFVMFGFKDSFTVDDASVISDRVVRDLSLATSVLVTKVFKKEKIFNKSIEEKFGTIKGITPKGYSSNGLPLVGTYLRPGSNWLYRYEKNLDDGTITNKTLRLANSEHGEVISVENNKEEIKVTLAKWVQVQVGDKFSGRQGNKTIISRVMPREKMPFHPESGRYVDIIINPLGIPSRGNISQLSELQASAEVEARGLDTKVIPPFSNALYDMVKNYESGKDLTELQLINSETGLYYPNKHFCGYMHYLRNAKIAEDQHKAIGDSSEIDVAFLQPVGGSELGEKGQSISSMEKEILVSYGADGILDEIHSVLSADRAGFREANKFFEEHPEAMAIDYKGHNHHSEHMQHVALAFHTAMKQDGDNIELNYMSDKDMDSFVEIDPKQIEYGLTDRDFLETMMYIPLSRQFITPVAIRKFKFTSIIPLTKITYAGDKNTDWLGKDSLESIIEETAIFVIREIPGSDVPMLITFPRDLKDEHLAKYNLDTEKHYTGMSDLIDFLIKYPIELWIESFEQKNPGCLNKEGVFSEDLYSRLSRAKANAQVGGFERYITTRFPVLPNKYRQAKNEINDSDSLTAGYKDIIRLSNDMQNSDSAASRLYNRMAELMLPSSTGNTRLSLFEFMAKKDKGGRIRGKILKTRVLCSMRSTIVPMFSGDPKKYGYPDFAGHPDSIGLPLIGALRIAQPRLLGYMKKHHMDIIKDCQSEIDAVSKVIDILTLPLDSVQAITEWTSESIAKRVRELKAELIDFINGSYVFYGRAPSLQETSLRGGIVYVHEEKVIHLHSLLTTDFNADHDGDQMYVVMPITEKSVEDIKTKLMPSTNALKYNDGEPSLIISQDALLGLYFATEDPTSETVRPVVSVEQVQYFIELGQLKLNELVILNKGDIQIKTTAGRLLVHNIIYDLDLPNFTDYLEEQKDKDGKPLEDSDGTLMVKHNHAISGSGKGGVSISDLQLEIAEHYKDSKLITDIYNELQKFGYKAAELRNLTVGIKDLTPALAVESINKEVKSYVEIARTLEELGLLPDDYLIDLDRQVNNLITELDIMSKVPDDNAFKILAVSGAKGKKGGIEKMFGVQGFVDGNNGVKLETPILSNTVKGISQFQVEDLSYTQRDNAMSTIFETSKPGETLRTGAFELSGLIIQPNQDDDIKQLVYYVHKETLRFLIGEEQHSAVEFSATDEYHYQEEKLTNELLQSLAKASLEKVALDEENKFLFIEKYIKMWIGKNRKSAKLVESAEGYHYKGQEVDYDLLRQLLANTHPHVQLDEPDTFLFFDVEVHPFAKQYFKNKMDLRGKPVSGFKLERDLDPFPTHIDLATHANEFSVPFGISQKHAGFRAGTTKPYGVKENVGIKSSTATAQPANQLVISKRNMERAGGLDNGIDLFKAAIQNGNFYKNNREAFELLCPENGVVSVVTTPTGTVFRLKGESGLLYQHFISAKDEQYYKFKVKNNDQVFLGQTVIAPNTITDGERPVSPLQSFVWASTTVTPAVNSDLTEPITYTYSLINPSTDLVQLIRFYFMVYLESIYRINNISLDPNHYGSFALQATRFCRVLKVSEDAKSSVNLGYLNLHNYFHEVKDAYKNTIVKMELTKGADTIMLTAGPVAAMCYRDSITVASKASALGPLPEFGSISKVALGVNLKQSLGEELVIKEQETSRRVRVLKLEDEGESVKYELTAEEEEAFADLDFGDDMGDIFGESSSKEEEEFVIDFDELDIDEEESQTEPEAEEKSDVESTRTEVADVKTSSIFGGDEK